MSQPTYLFGSRRVESSIVEKVILREAIVYEAKLNKSGKSYYVYLPRKYNKLLEKIHRERREVRVIIIPD